MINTMDKLVNAWYALLNGALTYNSLPVGVFQEDVPEDTEGHYVILRAEGETGVSNKRSFALDSVVVVDIVTVFQNNVDSSVANNIDNQIAGLILTSPGVNGLSAQSGFQILNVTMETSSYLREYDNGSETAIYRKVSRYRHLAYQTA